MGPSRFRMGRYHRHRHPRRAMPRHHARPKTTSFLAPLLRPVGAPEAGTRTSLETAVRCARLLRRRRGGCHEGFDIALLKRSDRSSHVHGAFIRGIHSRRGATAPSPFACGVAGQLPANEAVDGMTAQRPQGARRRSSPRLPGHRLCRSRIAARHLASLAQNRESYVDESMA